MKTSQGSEEIHPTSEGRSAGRGREGRRNQLLAAALAVIRRDGPCASMDAMAAEAGITKPILYRHFGDRDGLIQAMAGLFADRLVDRLDDVLRSTREPTARIAAAIDGYVSFIEADPQLYAFLTEQAAVASPAVRGVVDRVAGVLRRALDEAFETAGLRGRPTTTWSYALVGMVHLAGARWAAEPPAPRSRLVAELTQLVANGLLADPDLEYADREHLDRYTTMPRGRAASRARLQR